MLSVYFACTIRLETQIYEADCYQRGLPGTNEGHSLSGCIDLSFAPQANSTLSACRLGRVARQKLYNVILSSYQKGLQIVFYNLDVYFSGLLPWILVVFRFCIGKRGSRNVGQPGSHQPSFPISVSLFILWFHTIKIRLQRWLGFSKRLLTIQSL